MTDRERTHLINSFERAIPYAENGMISVSVEATKEIIALLKEDCHNCKLECLLQKYDELKEKYDALLKEQEAIEPTINEYGEAYCICGENVGIIPSSKNLPSIRSKYCPECGRRMKWRFA